MTWFVDHEGREVERIGRRVVRDAWKLYAHRLNGELVELAACRGGYNVRRGEQTEIRTTFDLAQVLAEVTPRTAFRTAGFDGHAHLSAAAWEHLARRALEVIA